MRWLLFLLLAAGVPTIALAENATTYDLAEKRLRGCIAAGASTAPRVSLAAAVQHVRALCGAQTRDLADMRIAAATRGLSGAEADEAKADAIRALNNEIAFAVANFTGLTQ